MHTDITGKICTAAFKKHQNILVYALIGALVFIAVFGILPLNVAYDHWILNGYVEADIIQHYAGWLAYRQSTWSWPLGLTEGLGNGAITFTDSIPVLSILCKMIERILPETFQFFGPYVFFCIILQGIAAGKILELLTDDYKIILGGTLLFCASPILLERAFRHTALASHWLILFSIYLLIKSRQTKSMSWKYVLLSVLAIGIHPYFLPMIYAIFVTNALELAVHSFQHIKRVCFIFFTSIFATALFGYAIGALGAGGLSGGGFGIFSMNINALINPTSCGGLVWSKALPILPQILGNYDGFNYLGLGCIIAVPIALLYIYIYRSKVLKNNLFLIIMCFGLTIFALSNTVTCNDQIILEYLLPDWFMRIAEIFRASSRMFYPVYYCILLAIIWGICQVNVRKEYLLYALLIIQFWDISPALDAKFQSFQKENIEENFAANVFYHTEIWCDIAENFESIKMLNNSWDYGLAAFGGKCGKIPDITISRAPTIDLNMIYEKNLNELLTNNADPNAVYLVSDDYVVSKLAGHLPADYAVFDCGSYIAITSSSDRISAEKVSFPLMTANLTDENWDGGVWRHGDRILLFPYTTQLEEILQPDKIMTDGSSDAKIVGVQIIDKQWIHVSIEEGDVSLKDFQYPKFIYLKPHD